MKPASKTLLDWPNKELQGLFSTMALVMTAVLIYLNLAYYQQFISRQELLPSAFPAALQPLVSPVLAIVGDSPYQVLLRLSLVYLLVTVVKFISGRAVPLEEHRPYLFWKAVWQLFKRSAGFFRGQFAPSGKEPIDSNALVSLRYYGVKFFFLPMMLNFLFGNITSFLSQSASFHSGSLHDIQYLVYLYLLGYYAILLADTACFAFGYTFELSRFSKVRSVEPTILGWAVALACYAPFNTVTSNVLGWGSQDYGTFASPLATGILLGLSFLLFLIYGLASVALGPKASNLTNRGIVSWGPYAVIRHPAYLCKNLGWILMGLPLLFQQTGNGIQIHWQILFSLLAWAFVYYMRAMTEERHLMADPDYQAYCQKVRWRFIPGMY